MFENHAKDKRPVCHLGSKETVLVGLIYCNTVTQWIMITRTLYIIKQIANNKKASIITSDSFSFIIGMRNQYTVLLRYKVAVVFLISTNYLE